MIYCIEGTPGVGKSLYFVSKLIPEYLKIRSYDGSYAPVHIWTNIEGLKPSLLVALSGLPESITMYIHNIGEYIDKETGKKAVDKRYLEWFYYDPSTIEWIEDYDQKSKSAYWHPDFDKAVYLPLNSLVILDELQNVFGSRDFDKPFTKAVLPYITRHRHYGHNIFWASQNHEQVDVSFRRNTEQVWHLDSLANFALFGGAESFKISKFEGKYAGYQVNVNPYAVQRVHKDKRYFVCYKSHVSDEVKEKHHTTNMFTHSRGLRIVACIVVLFVGLIVYNFVTKGGPVGILTGSHGRSAAPVATPAPSKGLVPVGVVERSGGGVPAPDTTLCYTNMYISHGQIKYLLNNGKSVFHKKGVEYDECH